MTIKTVYIGSEGPFKYDDQLDLDDPDRLFPGIKQNCIVTDGELQATVVKVIDLSGEQISNIYESINALEEIVGDTMGGKDQRLDYDISDHLIYRGTNAIHDAATSSTDWNIWKFTWDGEDVDRVEGPLVGSWNGRTGLDWGV